MFLIFVCLYNYEFWLSLCTIVRSSVILLLLLFNVIIALIYVSYAVLLGIEEETTSEPEPLAIHYVLFD
jgi:hypothetical protein